MITNFNNIEPVIVNNLRGGNNYCILYKCTTLAESFKMYAKIIIPPTSSIGMHYHTDDEETIYVLEGSATIIDNGVTKTLNAGDINTCLRNELHSIINNTTKDLVILAVVSK